MKLFLSFVCTLLVFRIYSKCDDSFLSETVNEILKDIKEIIPTDLAINETDFKFNRKMDLITVSGSAKMSNIQLNGFANDLKVSGSPSIDRSNPDIKLTIVFRTGLVKITGLTEINLAGTKSTVMTSGQVDNIAISLTIAYDVDADEEELSISDCTVIEVDGLKFETSKTTSNTIKTIISEDTIESFTLMLKKSVESTIRSTSSQCINKWDNLRALLAEVYYIL